MIDMVGKSAVVTGAGAGIGAAVAQLYADLGAKVVVADIDHDAAKKIAEVIGEAAIAFSADVADEVDVVALADSAVAELGAIDVWVNNAGIIRPSMLLKMSVEDFDSVMAVHARGTFLGLREAGRRMVETDRGGSIINVTSAAGLDGTIGQVNYAGAKGAIVAMTKSGARELGRHAIRVNAVAPIAATDMTEVIRTDERFAASYLERMPLGRWAMPGEVAYAFAYLGCDLSSFTTGQMMCVDGGIHMAS